MKLPEYDNSRDTPLYVQPGRNDEWETLKFVVWAFGSIGLLLLCLIVLGVELFGFLSRLFH